jgi:3-deoxy-D-manno-octulosonic-acid transferase
MGILLDVLYLLFLIIASPIILWRMIRHGKYREGLAEKFLGISPETPEGVGRVVWFHAVSVGEVNLLRPILPLLRQSRPDWHIVISSTSKTGRQLAETLFSDLTVFYCPLDFSWAVGRALRRVRPNLLVLAELELWPNLINMTIRRGAKVAIINGRISDKSFKKYRKILFFLRPLMKKLALIAASDKLAARYFRSLGADEKRLHITGSIKFDGVQTDRQNPDTSALARLVGIRTEDSADRPADTVFLAGSTQEPEEKMALDAFRAWSEKFPALRLILVPRHPERFEAVVKLLDESNLPWFRRTALIEPVDPGRVKILLVDTIGELGAWWGTASIAFVGGSVGKRGGQNMLEPAAYGAAVCFGPNTKNFREISERMVRDGAAVVVRNAEELNTFLGRCLTEPEWGRSLGEAATRLVLSQQGACRITTELLAEL